MRPRSTEAGLTEISGVGARVPRPDRATSTLGVSASVDSMVRVALRAPSVLGAKVTFTAQDAEGSRPAEQLLVWVKTSASAPLMVMLFRPRAAVPVLVMVTDC